MANPTPRSKRALRTAAKLIVRDHLDKLYDTVELPEWAASNTTEVQGELIAQVRSIVSSLIERGRL